MLPNMLHIRKRTSRKWEPWEQVFLFRTEMTVQVLLHHLDGIRSTLNGGVPGSTSAIQDHVVRANVGSFSSPIRPLALLAFGRWDKTTKMAHVTGFIWVTF